MSTPEPEPVRHRLTHHLSHGRLSAAGATYFITFNTLDRRQGLTHPPLVTGILDELEAAIGSERLLIATVMPDHVHALLVLGPALTLSQTIARVKAKTRPLLEPGNLAWQRGFFDRRLRENESQESYALYVFMNPYRASLLPLAETWPATRAGAETRFRFLEDSRQSGGARREWLGLAAEFERTIGFTPD